MKHAQPWEEVPEEGSESDTEGHEQIPVKEVLLSPEFSENVYNAAIATQLTKGEAIFYVASGRLSRVHSLMSKGYKKSMAESASNQPAHEAITHGSLSASIGNAIDTDDPIEHAKDYAGLEFILHSHPGGHGSLQPSFQDLSSWEAMRYEGRATGLNLEAILTVESGEARVLLIDLSGDILGYYQDEDRFRLAARNTQSMRDFLEKCGMRTCELTMDMKKREFSGDSARALEKFLEGRV